MSNAASIIATLGLERGRFKSEIEATEADLEKTQAVFKETAAAVAILERALASDASNKTLKANLSTLKASLRDTGKEMTLLTSQKRALDAAMGSGGPTASPGRRTAATVGEGEEHGGNARMANMEAGHSVRAVFSSIGAGQGLQQALQMELPRLLQAAGAGLGTMIGIEFVPLIVNGLRTMFHSAAIEARKFASELSGDGGGTGVASTSSLNSRLLDLQKAEQERLDSSGGGEPGSESQTGAAWRGGKNLWRMLTGQRSVEDEEGEKIEVLAQRRLQLQSELVKRKEDEAALDAQAFSDGKDAVAVAKAQLETREKIQEIVSDTHLDGDAKANLRKVALGEGARRESEAAIGAADHQRSLAARKEIAELDHPEMVDPNGGIMVIDSDAQGRAVTKARIDMESARLHQTAVAKNGGDTKEADTDLEEKTGAFLDAVKAAREELATAKAQTVEAQLQLTGHQNAAQIEGIRAQYEERIAKAISDGKTDLAEQLNLHQKISIEAAQLAEFRKTPQQHAQDRLKGQKDEQDLKQMHITQRRELESRRQNYEDEHRASLPLDAKKRAEAIAKAVPDLDGVLDKKQGSTVAKEAAGNATGAAFDARFHPKAPQPQVLQPAPKGDPQQQANANDSHDGDAVHVLEEIKSILNDRLKLTIP